MVENEVGPVCTVKVGIGMVNIKANPTSLSTTLLHSWSGSRGSHAQKEQEISFTRWNPRRELVEDDGGIVRCERKTRLRGKGGHYLSSRKPNSELLVTSLAACTDHPPKLIRLADVPSRHRRYYMQCSAMQCRAAGPPLGSDVICKTHRVAGRCLSKLATMAYDLS